MNLGLFNKRYLAAGQYTIADMIWYPWASSWASRKIDIEEFPNVKRWLEEIGERPAVKKAMAMGPEFREDLASLSAEEQARRRALVADQRARQVPQEWVRAAQA
jgi:GST-like protein